MTSPKKQAIFIRHGQSVANVGLWEGNFSEIPLTETGQQQAEALAAQWDFTPDRIIVSPYLRTQQTAAPTIARFPNVPVETWDIHEFTYWDRAHWGDTTPEDAQEEVFRYWRIADPEHRLGAAETFSELLLRTEAALDKLKTIDGNRILLFTHGHFIQALRHTLLYPHWDAAQKMSNFRAFDERWRVKNTELATVKLIDGTWRLKEDPTQTEIAQG